MMELSQQLLRVTQLLPTILIYLAAGSLFTDAVTSRVTAL